ncbi:MAG: hypothetical protein HY393_02255 [Candidatus Diapherotrites archaeon]|nr:hypothetical protein [Candidatus Diapherotrites archaeon]
MALHAQKPVPFKLLAGFMLTALLAFFLGVAYVNAQAGGVSDVFHSYFDPAGKQELLGVTPTCSTAVANGLAGATDCTTATSGGATSTLTNFTGISPENIAPYAAVANYALNAPGAGGLDTVKPDDVTSINTSPGAVPGTVNLAWDNTQHLNDSTMDHFTILYADNPIDNSNYTSATVAGITATSANTFIVNGLVPGDFKFFTVQAIDKAGNVSDIVESPFEQSATTSGGGTDTNPPEAPAFELSPVANMTDGPGGMRVLVKTPGTPDATLSHYNVYASASSFIPGGVPAGISSGTIKLLATLSATQNGITVPEYASGPVRSYQIGGLTPSTTFYFIVEAVDGAGNKTLAGSVKSAVTGKLPSGSMTFAQPGEQFVLCQPSGCSGTQSGVSASNSLQVSCSAGQTPLSCGGLVDAGSGSVRKIEYKPLYTQSPPGDAINGCRLSWTTSGTVPQVAVYAVCMKTA